MTAWLWIIGIIAVAWPIVIAFYLDHVFTKWTNLIGSRSENAHVADQRAAGMRSELVKLHGVIEEHEALIVALWQRTFGFRFVDGFDRESLPGYLGVKPDWQGFAPEANRPVAYLVKHGPYPWGSSADNLYFDRKAAPVGAGAAFSS